MARLERLVASLAPEQVAAARWFGGKERRVQGIALGDALVSGPDAALLLVEVVYADGPAERYSMPALLRGDSLREPSPGERFWGPLLALLARAPRRGLRGTFELRRGESGPLPAGTERELGADQSNSSYVIAERLVVKCYRRLHPGIHPEVELATFLTGRFPRVPPAAGSLHYLPDEGFEYAVALLQTYVPDAEDGWEWAQRLLRDAVSGASGGAAWAEELGAVTAGLHVALAEGDSQDFEPRRATHEDLRSWRRQAEEQLERVCALVDGETAADLRERSPAIRAELALFEEPAELPLLTRVHGDYHLGQVVRAPGGLYVVDFEGEPTRTAGERRALGSPLRDVASMLRSLDHVPRWALRGGADTAALTAAEIWAREARDRFLDAYELGVAGTALSLDGSLLRAFEVEKETYELAYAATFLPEWTPVARDSMRALLAQGRV